MNSPRYLNLFKIALPLPGVLPFCTEFLQLLFCFIPSNDGILVFSLSSEANYQIINSLFENFLLRACFPFSSRNFLSFCLRLRHLVMDFGYWETLRAGRMSALATFISTGLFFFLFFIWHGNEVIQIKENRNL